MESEARGIRAELGGRTYWFVSSVEAYRALAASLPAEGDVVWELGAAAGAATVLAAGTAREIHAVEKAPEKLEKLAEAVGARENVHIVEADALEGAPPEGARADLLLVDLGGDAPPWRTMEAADAWARALGCERVVVRNTAMSSLMASGSAGEPPSGPEEAAGTDPTLLVQPVLDVVSRERARRMAEGLKEGGFKARQRLVEGLVALGPTALRPLVALVDDMDAPLATRRAAAETVRQIMARVDRETGRALRSPSAPLEWALGAADGETAGAELAAAERKGKPPSGAVLLRLLGHHDELAAVLARQHLKAQGEDAARKLVLAAAEEKAVLGPTVTAMDALATVRGAAAERVVEWYIAAGGRRDAPWRLAAACLGIAEQRWAGALLHELEAQSPELPAETLRKLMRAAQKKPRGKDAAAAQGELLKLEAPIPMLASAASLSPHPWMRELAEAMAEAVAEEDDDDEQ